MKTAFRISLLVNLGLAGGLLFCLVHRPRPRPLPMMEAARLPSPSQERSAPVQLEPFRWDELYAADYHDYVSKLRGIGCPESTLRAIVAADVHPVVQTQVAELENNLAAVAGGSWAAQLGARTNVEKWREELQHLPDEEAAMIADYLGEKPALLSGSRFHRRAADPARAEEPIVAPLVAQPVDLASLNLDPGQLEAVKNLQSSFLKKIGGPNQDPNDPAYRARWQAAQAEMDNLMQGMLGDQAYQDYQLKAWALAQQDKQSSQGVPVTAGEN